MIKTVSLSDLFLPCAFFYWIIVGVGCRFLLYRDEDILGTLHDWLGILIVELLAEDDCGRVEFRLRFNVAQLSFLFLEFRVSVVTDLLLSILISNDDWKDFVSLVFLCCFWSNSDVSCVYLEPTSISLTRKRHECFWRHFIDLVVIASNNFDCDQSACFLILVHSRIERISLVGCIFMLELCFRVLFNFSVCDYIWRAYNHCRKWLKL